MEVLGTGWAIQKSGTEFSVSGTSILEYVIDKQEQGPIKLLNEFVDENLRGIFQDFNEAFRYFVVAKVLNRFDDNSSGKVRRLPFLYSREHQSVEVSGDVVFDRFSGAAIPTDSGAPKNG